MNKFSPAGVLLAALALTVSLSCGDPNAGGGVGGTGISYGTIQKFGSVFVNGVEFNTDNTEITVNGNPAGQADLAIGMVVTVRGTINSGGTKGTADTINYDSNLEGPVDFIDAGNGFLVVAGQNVTVDADTAFDDIPSGDLTGLSVGNIVEVSGFVDGLGTVRATRIKFESGSFEPGTTQLEIRGTVSNLDTAGMTFDLGDLKVDYSQVNAENLPSGGLANGMAVEVHSTEGIVDGALIASQIQAEDLSLGEHEGETVEVEGFVTAFTSQTDFEVNGQRVQTDSQTKYEGGTAADIGPNVKLEVKGTIIAGDILLADRIEIKNGNED
jgi:hypothetical protein